MKKLIKIVNNNPKDIQSDINEFVGMEFETLELKNFYDNNIVKEMNKLGEIAVLLEKEDSHPSIINKDEYIYL